MNDPRDQDTFADFVDGDLRAGALLRDNLTALRDQLRGSDSPVADRAAGETLRRGIDDVLAGRRSMRDLARDPALVALSEQGMREAHGAWQQLPADQRAAQVRAGRERDDAR